jgi:septal ring factor EnvC (AmiA/AmiB activator)
LSCAALFLALVAAATPADSPEAAPPASLLDTIDARLEKVRGRRKSLEQEITRLQHEEHGLLSDLERIDLEVRLRGAELREVQIVLEKSNLELNQTVRRVSALERSLDAARPIVASRIRALYKLGRLSYVRLLLSVEEPTAILEGYRYVTALARKDNDRITAFRRDLATLNATREELIRKTQEAQSLRLATQRKRRGLEAERQHKREFLREIVATRENHAAFVAELNEAEERLQQLLSGFGEGRVKVPIAAFKGTLPWPVTGRVRVPFGRRKHPKFDTYTIQNGVEIQARTDTAVAAVHEGTVVFADRLLGYGLLVVVDHGGRHLSLYGRLAETAVRVGQEIAAGQVLGTIGAGVDESGLYFEMRFQGKPEDPLDWLRKGPV